MFAVIILLFVFILIAVRQIGNIRLQIWQIMLMGAVIALVTFQITPLEAWKAINFDVIFFLFGVFFIGAALEESGYLEYLSDRLFSNARSMDTLIILVLFSAGITSALLMNDTLAIIGTPIVLLLARNNRISSKLMLLALAFGITIGSVMSPIGNPQNLLIAINSSVADPFGNFFKFLFIPTMLNLLVGYYMLKVYFRKEFEKQLETTVPAIIKEPKLANATKLSLILMIALILLKILSVWFKWPFDFKLTYIALISMLPIIVLSSKRILLLKQIDWQTLVFFAAMFVLMQCVWNSGFFQGLINKSSIVLGSLPAISGISIMLSQFISNVPMVALYLPILTQSGTSVAGLMVLAAASTIAGNLLILGAASNVIIIQKAERMTGDTITFLEFAKIGVPMTILNMAIYLAYIYIVMS